MSNRMELALFGFLAISFGLANVTSADGTSTPKPRGIVIDFSATWCGPCQQMAPLVEKLARQGFSIRSVDVDQRPDLKRQFNVSSLPTFVLIVDGKEVQRRVGAMPEAEIRRMLAAIPASAPPAQLLAENAPVARNPQPRPVDRTQAPLSKAKSALLDMLPGRQREEAPASLNQPGTVVRGNADDRIPAMSIAKGPMASSVRIRVKSGDHLNFGSGTIIGSTPGRATIATCWHIFRGATRDSKIEVDTFFTGRNETYVAKLIGADEKADVGIIEISTDTKWPIAKVAPADRVPRVDEHVVSIGCGGGQDPTRQSIQVTAVDKYHGPSNIECSGMPVRGRSGGGLFNARGELIGVCSAADKEDKRGIYAGLTAVHNVLDQNGLASLYRETDSLLAAAEPQEARSRFDASIEPVGFGDTDSNPGVNEFLGGSASQAPKTANESNPLNSNPVEPNPWEDFAANGATGRSVPATRPDAAPSTKAATDDVEIVCIIRSKSKPKLGSRVIVIDQSDPRLVALLREYDRKSQQTAR